MVNLTSYISPSNLFLFGLSLSILSPLLYIIVSWERTKPNSLTVAFCFRHSPRCGGNEWNEHPQSPKEQYPGPDGLRQHLENLNDFFQATCECCQKRDPIPNTCGCANGNRMHGCGIELWLYWPRDHSHGNGQDFACCGVRIPVGKCEIRLLFSSDQVVFGLHSQTHHEDPTPTFPSFFTFHHGAVVRCVTLTPRAWMLIPPSWKMLWMPSESSCFSEGEDRDAGAGSCHALIQPTSTRQNTWYMTVLLSSINLNLISRKQPPLKGLSARFQSPRKI